MQRTLWTFYIRRFGDADGTGEERVPEFDGFECEGYVGADGLEDALARFNLLHVGAGAQRFQPAG